jgi:hypothetical protein
MADCMILAGDFEQDDKDPVVFEVNFPKKFFVSTAVFDMTVVLVLEEDCGEPVRVAIDDMEWVVGFVLGVYAAQVAGLVFADVGEDLYGQDLGTLVGGCAAKLFDGETHQTVVVAGMGNVVGRDQVDGTD